MLPFDVLTIETSYLTSDHYLVLFLESFARYFKNIQKYVRLVVCINSGDDNIARKKFNLLKNIHEICEGYNYLIFECNKPTIDQWREKHGINCRPDFINLSHGHVVYKYLYEHCNGVMFTLLTHSDIEFIGDMCILEQWQAQLLSDPNLAAVNGWDFPQVGVNAENMNLALSLWKTPVLSEFAITKQIELGGVDKRLEGGLFYDTGSWLLKLAKEADYTTVRLEAPVRHWGGITSMLLSRSDYDALNKQIGRVYSRISELREKRHHV